MEETDKPYLKYCRNCQHPMPSGALYCEQCGQKYTTGKITFPVLLRETLDEIFNLDSKIFRTLAALFVPGKLTNEYFAGRHRRYVHPIRLFFISAVVFFALLGIVVVQNEQKNTGLTDINNDLYEQAYRSKFMNDLEAAQDSVRRQLPAGTGIDLAFDTLAYFLKDPRKNDRYVGYLYLTDNWAIRDTAIAIDYQDILALPRDSFYAKYQVDGIFAQTILRQSIRLQNNEADFLRYVMGQLVWMVLLMMPLLAFILKILYIRRRRYYIEHLIFSFHYHAFGFVIFLLPIIYIVLPFEPLSQHDAIKTWLFAIAGIGLTIYLFSAMRRVYRQRFFKTLLKFGILNFLYLFVFTIMVLLLLVTSVFLY